MSSNVVPIDPLRWERGCITDPVRNQFVVPTVVELLDSSEVRSVLDVGCGTGYVAREAASRSPNSTARWTLLDSDPHVLNFASNHSEAIGNADYVNMDIGDYVARAGAFKHDLAIVCYTLLEVVDLAGFVESLRGTVSDGRIVIFVPDTIPDIISSRQGTSPIEMQESKRTGVYPLNKIDHFTGEPLTFLARQSIDYVTAMLSIDTRLERVASYTSPSGGRHFGLIFRRTDQA